MSSLVEIVARLLPEERERLCELHGGRGAIVSRMIVEAMEERRMGREEFIAQHGITEATYNKSQSQAIDAVYEVIQELQRNPYDPIILIRQLLFRGLVKEARKQFHSLEKEYEKRNLYAVLDALYHEGVRICYHTGDIKWLEMLVKKIIANAEASRQYSALDSPLILQMLKLEKRSFGRSAATERELMRLLGEAERVDHPVPIHNALYSLYAYYTAHDFDIEKAHRVARQILDNVERHGEALDRYTMTISYNNYAHFLTIYLIDEDPEPYFRLAEKHIGMGGVLELFDFRFQRFQYYLFTGQRARSQAMYALMLEAPQENRLALLGHVAAAWLAFDAGDADRFRETLAQFYELPSYQDFPEHEFHLRAMEIILALRRGDYPYAEQKGEALRKFHFRKLGPAADYRLLANSLQRRIYAGLQAGSRKRGGEILRERFVVRSAEYLFRILNAEA
jgi:hypothetical protein